MDYKLIQPTQIRLFDKYNKWIVRAGFCRIGSNRIGVGAVTVVIQRLISRILFGHLRPAAESSVLDLLLYGYKGNGKKALAKLGCEYLTRRFPKGHFVYCDDPVRKWEQHEMCPEAWWTADMLALCDFWNETASADYADEMTMLLKERRNREKLTILTTDYAVSSFPGMSDDLYKLVRNGLEAEVESVVTTKDLVELIRWTNERCGLILAEHVIRHLASRLSGSSGSVIEQVMRVAKFAEENPAVPLIKNVIDYVLSNVE